ncbi:Capsular polysaccharide synthesis enzyme Cap5L [Staphylococcus aureus]|nr:Capsular polysaccharide synthesis enzyme Cap5L [Staphylococcus aureus]
MSEKKILILCQYFYPEYVSSATLPTQLAEDLIANHINVDVMCGWPYEYSNHKQVSKNRDASWYSHSTSQVFEV